jgi:hypothetical protein
VTVQHPDRLRPAAGWVQLLFDAVPYDRAIAAVEIRAAIRPEVLRALVGTCYLHDQPGW